MVNRAVLGGLTTFFVSVFFFFGAGVLYVSHAIGESQKRLCGVIRLSIEPHPTSPVPQPTPTSEAGKALVRYNEQQQIRTERYQSEMKKVSKEYSCPKGDTP